MCNRAVPIQNSKDQDDHTEARRRWQDAPHIANTLRSYAEDRGISRSTLDRFPNEVRAGAFGGVYFAHRAIETGDIQGFEQRWQKDGQKNAARFARGGRKTVNVLGDPLLAIRMVVLEGGLDALALAEFEARQDTIYVSTGGGYGLLTEASLQRLAQAKEVLSGFDSDDAGAAMHEKLCLLLPAAKRYAPALEITGSKAICKDWLDVLNVERGMTTAVFQGPALPNDRETVPDLIITDPESARPPEANGLPEFS